jgi:hypothetical protein
MKIFDFSTGKKGNFLAEATCGALGGWWLDGKRIDGNSVKIGGYQYHKSLHSRSGKEITPESLGVEAICFCQVFENNGNKVYNWYYVCTKKWLDANVDWKWDNSANELNKKGMIDDLMEGIAFEEDYQIERALNRYAAMSYEAVKKEWMEVTKGLTA